MSKTGIKYLMLERSLHHMYQQWQQGNDNYIERYMDFVSMVARIFNYTTEEVLVLLENTSWFKRPKQ